MKQEMQTWGCAIALLLLSPFLTGCGKGHDASVSGTVMLDGKPLGTGVVAFSPTQEGPVACGGIDTNGHYCVQTGTDKGLQAGQYVVTVVASTGPPPDGKLLTPARYGNPKESGLQCEVTAGSNHFDISLFRK